MDWSSGLNRMHVTSLVCPGMTPRGARSSRPRPEPSGPPRPWRVACRRGYRRASGRCLRDRPGHECWFSSTGPRSRRCCRPRPRVERPSGLDGHAGRTAELPNRRLRLRVSPVEDINAITNSGDDLGAVGAEGEVPDADWRACRLSTSCWLFASQTLMFPERFPAATQRTSRLIAYASQAGEWELERSDERP